MNAKLLLLVALFCFLLLAEAPVPAGEEKDKETTKVEGSVVVPKDLPSFKGRLLEIRLYKSDPRLADASADLVEKVEVKDFEHKQDRETKKAFTIGAKGKLEPKMG